MDGKLGRVGGEPTTPLRADAHPSHLLPARRSSNAKVGNPRFLQRNPNFLRKGTKNFTQYISEGWKGHLMIRSQKRPKQGKENSKKHEQTKN